MTYVSVDVDIDDILNGLSSRELQRLADDLYDDGYYQTKLERELNSDDDTTISLNEKLYRNEISKLRVNYHNLTNQEIEILMNIAKRF
jgi:hypothetical protein